MRLLLLLLMAIPVKSFAIPFFKVTFHGKVSYLLGTMHQPFRREVIPGEIFKHLDQAGTVYFESNPDAPAWRNTVDLQNAEAGGIKKLLSTEEWLRLKRVLQAAGYPSERFNLLPPAQAFTEAYVAFETTDSILIQNHSKDILKRRPDLSQLGDEQFKELQKILQVNNDGISPPNAGLDDVLRLQIVRNPKIHLHYLDSEAGPGIDLTPRQLKEYIVLRLKRQRAIKSATEEVFENYIERKFRQGPSERFYLMWRPGLSLFKGSTEPASWFLPEALKAMRALQQRHSEWWEAILPGLQKGGAFVVVGAGHVVGADSLVKLAETHGAKVEFVNLPIPCESILAHRGG